MNHISQVKYFLGIDISNLRLDCWLRPNGQHLRCKNSSEGFTRIHHWLKDEGCKPANTIICLEQTGVYGKQLLRALHNHHWNCALEKTTILNKVRPEHHRKDDKFDARLLAEYADRFIDQLHLTAPTEPLIDRLQQLCSERRRLVRQRTAVKNKQNQAEKQPQCPSLLHESWEQQMALFNQQINDIENRMQQIVESKEKMNDYYDLLKSIPGVGSVTAWIWLTKFYGQHHLNPKKVASRFGLAPHRHQSGSSVKGETRSSGHGASQIRSALAMAAQSISSHDEKFKEYKERKRAEGKPWPVIRNNMINKLITIICAIWNTQQPYNPNHTSRFDRQKDAA